jgi:hypothetical protein
VRSEAGEAWRFLWLEQVNSDGLAVIHVGSPPNLLIVICRCQDCGSRAKPRFAPGMGKSVVVFAVVAGCAALVALSATAGTQQCNTACQARMTDCILGCDGRLPCELACKAKAEECVTACSSGAISETPNDGVVDGGRSMLEDARAAGASRVRAAIDAAKIEAGKIDAGKTSPSRDR